MLKEKLTGIVDFFQSKTVKLVAAAMILLGAVVLLLGGTDAGIIQDLIVKAGAVVVAIYAVVEIIEKIIDAMK